MKSKIITVAEAAQKVTDGMTVMVGGFLAVGSPESIIDELVKNGVKDLTIINNDTGWVDRGVGKLVVHHQVKKAIVSHVGTNPETGKQMHAKEMEVVLTPQGTLAEKIRCGGAGLGGFLTPTGIGTMVAEGKEVITIDGVEYLLEKPLKANIALLKASMADEKGNLIFNATTRNFNSIMALAADIVIAEVDKIVPAGEIHYDHVMTPGILVDYLCLSGRE